MNSVLSPKEKLTFYSLLVLFILAIIAWGSFFYYSHTEAVPDFGGEYIEGIVGQPMHVNPLLSQSNDIDSDLSQIIYSGIMKYDREGRLTNDLAESYEISEDKTEYTFHLKQNVLWHDGELLTAKDVAFTVNLIANPSYKSPLRSNWQGIETKVIDDYTLSFKIQNPYVGFLSNLTFGILPEHIWGSVEPEKFPLTKLNLEPIGSGPFKFDSLQKDDDDNIFSYKLSYNPDYFEGRPFISKLTFNFYSDEDALIDAYNRKEIMGLGSVTPQKLSLLKLPQSTQIHKISIPRYFAVFFNQTKSVSLANDEVREALAYATDRNAIISDVLGGNGNPIYSPILPGMVGYEEDIDKREFDPGKAETILEEKGWKKGDDGVREKDGVRLEFSLITTQWEELVRTSEMLAKQWENIGARVNVNVLSISDIQQNYIRPREYDALLFGQVLGSDPDPYSFWHSTQKKDPGLNLALFGDDDTDKLIEEGRMEFNPERRAEKYSEFSEKITQEIPAIFLYSPDFVYPVNKKVRGIDVTNLVSPSERFSEVNKWFIKTDRIWK